MKKLKVSPSQPLLKFPLLVQIEIIKTMEPSEQYFLSKCSKRTHGAVKISIPKNQNPEIWIHPISPSVDYYLKIAGARFFLFKSYFQDYNRTHEYLCDLFSAPSEVYLEADGTRAEKFLDETLLEAGSVKKSILTRTTESMHVSLDQFSKLHPNQEFIHVKGTYTDEMCKQLRYMERSQPGHSFLKAENLMLSTQEGFCSINILRAFQGDHLLIENGFLTSKFVEIFVENWMRKKNDKLKTAIVKHCSLCQIKDLKYEKFSSRHYQYNSIIKRYHKFRNGLFGRSEGWKVRRATDGKVATIKYKWDYFMFLVW